LVGAVAILVPLLTMLWLDAEHNFGYAGLWLIPLGMLFAGAASSEIMMLRTDQKWTPDVTAAAAGSLVAAAIMFVPVFYRKPACPLGTWGWTAIALFAALVVVCALKMRTYREGKDAMLPHVVFSVVYIILPLSFLLQTRLLHLDQWGVIAVLSVATIVKFSDAGAYFVGRFFGKRPMAPILSPKKTIEGAIGGIVTAVLVAMILHFHFFPYLFGVHHAPRHAMGILTLVVYGLSITVAGIFGDLAESYLKRTAGQKDSAKWLPGLGGCLDVLDSVLWAAPVGYLWWAADALGPAV
jgi:phosphatidate cytidylyltransferase